MKNALILLVCLCAAAPAMFGQTVPAKGSIEGQVVDAKTNAPVRKAAVSLQGGMPFARPGQPLSNSGPLRAETDAKGNFAFRGVEPGNYRLSGQHEGYVAIPYQGYPTVSVVLGRGQDLKGVIVKLTPQAVITGKVLDEDGEAVQGAQVATIQRDGRQRGGSGWNPMGNGQTNDLGEYRIAGLTPGSYVVRATWRNNMPMPYYDSERPLAAEPELEYIPTHYPSAADASKATPVTVAMGAEIHGIDIRLRKAKTVRVRGRVEGVPASASGNGFGGGGPMPWVTLVPRDASRFDFSGNMTPMMQPGDGTFEIRGVLPGAYFLSAQWNDPNAKPPMAAVKPIDVSESIDGIVLRLDPARDVQGTVTVEEKTTVDLGNANVRLTIRGPIQGRYPQPARIASREFTLKDILPVPATVEVDGLPPTCYVKEVRYGGRPVPAEGTDLTSGEQLEIVLSTAVAELAGTVVDAKGKTTPNAVVTLISPDANGWPQQARPRVGGDFAINVKPGEYQAIAWETIDMNLLTPEFLKHFAGRITPVKLAPGAHQIVKLTLISLADAAKAAGLALPERPLGSIAGTIVDSKTGAPVKNATVKLLYRGGSYAGGVMRPSPAGNPYSMETDDRGRYSFPSVEPGFYRVAAQARGYATARSDPANTEEYSIVGDGQHLTGVVVKIDAQAVITGKIVDEDGEPLMRVRVSAALRSPDNRGAGQWRFLGSGETDDRGVYRIANLQPGSYLVRATYRNPGGPTFEQDLPEQPDMTYRARFYPDATEPGSAKPVVLATGAEVTGIDIKMQRVPTVRVRGKVTGEEPAGRANVRLVPKKERDGFPSEELVATRGPEGEFEFSGVRPGSYYLIAGGFSGSRAAVQSIDVGEKHIDGLTLDLAGRREIRAAFKLENGRGPVFFNLIPTIPGLPAINQNVMDGDTTLTLTNVAPIPYKIGDGLQPDYYWKSIVQGGQPITGHVIDFGVPGLLEITVSSGAARVDGSVIDSKGKPVPNAVLALAPAGGASGAVRTGTADAQGKFYFASLAPGDYRLAAWAVSPAGSIEDADFVRSSAANSAPLSLAPRDRKTVQVTANP
ncbi:MAG: carboxypeptidase-like regulatory domain-containing protein [Bryobacteraceae bacterium]|jgi:protocatechuate 3,4-dioxygenase beta subunit